MKTSRFLLPVVISLATAGALSAQGPDPRDEAARVLKQAEQAKAEGRDDEARELSERARRLKSEAGERDRREHGGPDRMRDEQFSKMKGEIEELRREGKRDEAERRMHEMREQWGRRKDRGDRGAVAEGPEKIRHIMEAVRHLRAAGVTEPAEHLEREAKRMQEEFEQHRRQEMDRREGDRNQSPEVQRQMNELREQVQKIAGEIGKLREELKRAQGGQSPQGPRPQ